MKQLSIAIRLKRLKPGDSFTVKGESQRQSVCRTAKALSDVEAIKTRIVTLHVGGQVFKVVAV